MPTTCCAVEGVMVRQELRLFEETNRPPEVVDLQRAMCLRPARCRARC